jgi:hypothetical protein
MEVCLMGFAVSMSGQMRPTGAVVRGKRAAGVSLVSP